MSNNQNRNRNRRPNPGQSNGGVQDRVFVFKSKTGAVIKVPSSVQFDPDAEYAAQLSDAQETRNELLAGAAMLRFIKSGFPDDIAETIVLKLSELEEFTNKYMAFAGANIPK